MNTQISSKGSDLSLIYYDVWELIQQLRKCACFYGTGTKNGTLDSWEMHIMCNSDCHLQSFPLVKHPKVGGHFVNPEKTPSLQAELSSL